MQQGKYIIPESFTDKTTPITTVEQPEPAVQPAPQSSTSGLKNFYDQAMKGVGAVTSLANPWNAITTMSKLLPSSVSSEIERGQQRFINSALLGLPQQAEKKITGQTPEYAQSRSWKDDKLGSALDFASTGAGYLVPGLGWIKGLSTTGRLGKLLLAGKVPQLAKGATTGQKIARTAKVAGQQAKEGAAAGAGLMGAEIGVREALNPQDYTWQQNLTDFGYGLAGGAVIDPLAYGAIKGVGRLFGRGQTPPTQPIPTTQNPTAPTIGNAIRLVRGQAPTGPVRVKKQLDEIINGKPPEQTPQLETQQTLDQILNDLTPEINLRLDPPLTNKANLAKWLKKYALPNESLSKIQKRPVEELRQLAIETRKNLNTRETAIEIAKEKNIDLDALFKQADAEKNINVQTLDNIINPQPRVETETQQTQAPETQQPTVPNREVISTGTSTGEVFRQGDNVYKPTTFSKSDRQTLEAEVYSELEGAEGIAKGRKVTLEDGKDYIETPFYKKVVSIDTIPKDKRKTYASSIQGEVSRMIKAIEELSNKGYDYSDPLQFGVNKDGDLDLMDFSNVSKVKLNEAVDSNYTRLDTFLRTFGLEKQADVISNAMRLKGFAEIGILKDIDEGMTLLSPEEIDIVRQIKRGGEFNANNVYYATNAREVQVKGIGQTEPIDGIKYIYSETPLSPKVIDEWELTKVYEQPKTPTQKPKKDVSRINKETQPKQIPSNTQRTPFATARRQTVNDRKFVTQTKEFDQKAIENYKKENPNSSFGYRSGKLDAIEKSEGFDQQFHNRGTGHFGTGHYFFGDADKAINYGRSSTRKRGFSVVDFSKYNLFKPKNDKIAEDFHYIAKDINNTIPSIGNLPATKLRAVKKLLYDNLEKSRKNVGNLDSEKYDNLNLSEGQSNAVYDMTQAVSRLADIIQESNLDKYKTHGDYLNIEKQILDIIFKDASTSKKVLAKGFANTFSPEVKAMDSTITKIMKSFGYEGIDVRGIQGFDSGRYGSVIYNIKPDSVPKSVSKNRTLVKSTPKQKTVPTINKESLDNIINPQTKIEQSTTTTKDVKSDEYLFSEQRRNDISEKIKKQFDRSIKDYEDAMKNAVDPRAREAGAKFAKGQRMAQAAAIREEIQGDLLIPIEGGLTGKELNAKLEYLRSNYEGKEVIVDGREGVIEKTVFGNTIIKFKDGSKVSYDYETLQKSNFQPKVDIEQVIQEQTDRKAIYDLETEAKQLKLTDRAINTLDNLEQQMRDFLKDSKNRLSSNPVDQYAAYAGIMAVKILKGTIKAADFTAELVKEFGEDIRPYASQILQRTSQIIKQQLNNAPASQQTPSPTTIPVSQSLPNPPSTVPASQQKPSRVTATVSKRLRKKGSVNVVSNLVNNTNNTTPAAITPIQYNKLNSFDHHTRDVYRNLQHALGQQTADKYLNMLDDAKKENLDMQQFWLKWLEDEVIKKYNIKRGSKSSKLVQMFGEQKITLAELQQRAPKDWQNIVDADKAFRFAYDKLIDDVNATRLQIHGLDVRIKDINQDPNLTAAEKKQQVDDLVNQATNEGKLVPKRSDYYRHFKDNGALYSYKNIYDTVSKIGDLTEEFKNITNSKILTSFVSFAKKRMGNKTKYDAVAGFLDYIPAASYAVKIDPMIKPFRELGEFIKQDSQIRNIDVGNLADYLDEFADDLANVRQNLPDKAVNSIESFKLVLSAAHLVTNMVKRNLLVGNLGTVLVQGSNLANAFGYTKQYALVGIYKTFNEFFNKNALSNQSTYLRERGFAKEYRRLDDRILMQPLNFANWLMETADMTTAKIIWNSAYAQGKAKKVADPMRYADDIARKSTAGRGVGEMPFINKGKLFNIVAPFQYDVANTLQVYRDIGINKKDVLGLASLMIAAYISNEILKVIRGSGGQLDLINAFKEASKKDLTPVQRGGRVLGELLSNIPLGQTVAAFDGIFPKYGGKTDILGFSVPTLSREELFGSADPTRFGEDMLLFNALKQPQYFVLPPFGGAQIRKTQEAITVLAKGKSEEDGQTRFLLDKSNPWRNLNTALFGIYTSPEGRRYLKEDQRMLSVQQSKMLDSLPKEQQKLFFEYTQNERRLNTIKSKATSITNDPTKTVEQKTKEINKLSEEYIKVSNDFQKFIAEQNKK